MFEICEETGRSGQWASVKPGVEVGAGEDFCFLQGGKKMAGTKLQVVKADGCVEEYLHTKVVGTISNALGMAGQADIPAAEELAEAVTYYLYHEKASRRIASSEIFSIIQAVLSATGYEQAAVVLSEHRLERKLRRCRVEVVGGDVEQLDDPKRLDRGDRARTGSRWDKSRIVEDLIREQGISRQAARMIASLVEEKVFGMGAGLVTTGLIKELVLGDATAVLRAERQLQGV